MRTIAQSLRYLDDKVRQGKIKHYCINCDSAQFSAFIFKQNTFDKFEGRGKTRREALDRLCWLVQHFGHELLPTSYKRF